MQTTSELTPEQKDFMVLMLVFSVATFTILSIVPIGKDWAGVAALLLIVACVMQLYWNRNLRPKNYKDL